ncbi:MAG: GNAT family N-acetyltransferase [Stackebrandtia sp.]
MKLYFRRCRDADVALLDQLNPTPSVNSFHAQRYAAQESGDATYLLALNERRPVGHALVKWNGCADDEVRDVHAGCPEINGLEVFPARLRSRGIGSQLIAACEDLARQRRLRWIGLGVADHNPRARQLYHSLRYSGRIRYVDRYTCIDSFGARHDFADQCVFLVKQLKP